MSVNDFSGNLYLKDISSTAAAFRDLGKNWYGEALYVAMYRI
jgi:hypothetical protein